MPYELGLEDTLPFGEYKGHQLKGVIENDPDYILWCYVCVIFEFDEEATRVLENKKII